MPKRNRVFMNNPKPRDEHERRMNKLFDVLLLIRPLDGTNLAYLYKREKPEKPQKRI